MRLYKTLKNARKDKCPCDDYSSIKKDFLKETPCVVTNLNYCNYKSDLSNYRKATVTLIQYILSLIIIIVLVILYVLFIKNYIK